ncbi:MAG: SMP-30/gluconolactonase/LRE family protein [Desulfovibrio sp.]|nr:SMP-30/gluconolactonase/LRE family protein [Desulfovibrio sp.]
MKIARIFTCLFLAVFLVTAFCGAIRANPVPIPPGELNLPVEIAEEWLEASPDNNILEGAIFDQDGNPLFCDVSQRKALRVSPGKNLETLINLPAMGAGGLAWHKDGRLFMAALDLAAKAGAILAWSPDSGELETIVPVDYGFWPNDLVFAPDGGFYFSDFRGDASHPIGGIYYVSPDFKNIAPVIPNLAQANGVALSPDGRTLWATEFAKNRLHRAELTSPSEISPTGSSIPWHFAGPAPDSMRVDSEGNVYVAIYGQGRAMIFNKKGIPIGQILIPGREKGENLLTTSLALDPGAKELFIVTSNDEKGKPARIFKAPAFAKGQKPVIRQK